jgi:hypothetical protein
MENKDNIDTYIISDEILNKITRLENRYLELKKEFKEIKERFAKLEKTKVIF